MTKWLCRKFALSEQGAKNLEKGIFWSVFAYLSLILPMGVFLQFLFEVLTPVLSGETVTPPLVKYLIICVAVLVVMVIFHWLQYGSIYIPVYAESATRRVTLAEKLRKLPLSFFGQRDLSDLTSTIMSDCESLEHAFSHIIPQFIGTLVFMLPISIGLLVMNWKLGLAVLWVFPVALAIVALTKKWQTAAGKKQLKAKIAVADSIQEGLETVREIKSYNLKEEYLAKLDEKLDIAEKEQIHSELVIDAFLVAGQMFLRLGLASVILIGNGLVIGGNVDILTYFTFLLAASKIYDLLSLVLTNVSEIYHAKIQIDRMNEIEEQPVLEGASEFTTNGYDVEFDHVSFAYNENEPVLKDVSFTAKQGEVTALVGPSGSGKSTAAKLAARFWDTSGGKIRLGGTDISTVDSEALLKDYAIVFQDVVLFNNTVMENIRIGRKDATDDEVIAAATAAHCEDFINKLPNRYQTLIGENVATLSGGERQRLSIARALLKNAPVVLLDEATASLDAENETQIQQAISRLIQGKTVLIIAHRMRTVADADQIIVLDRGVVTQKGTPDELMKQDGIYRMMVQLQQNSEAWSVK